MKKIILLIDDDVSMLQLTTELLELEGYEVMAANNGRQALELTDRRSPDLVLCDVTMPGMDGYGVLSKLGESPRLAEIPFIFVSARAGRADVRKGMGLGADDYLTKPFQAKELLDAVESRLRRSELFRRSFSDAPDGLDQFMDLARGLEALKDLGRDRKTRLFKEHDILFRQGDELHDVTYIVKGKVRTFNENKDRKEFTTGLHGPGDFIGYFGMLENGHTTESAEALEPVKVVLIPKEELFALLHKDHDVSISFIKLLSRDVEEMKQRLLQLAYSSIRQRVAQSLLRIHKRFSNENDPSLGVRITREDLASVVGTATESLIRSLSDFKEDQLISVDGRDIRILNKAGLEKIAHL
jgi:CRP/FNR family cyclic AMP-dependent transcriptional regulator